MFKMLNRRVCQIINQQMLYATSSEKYNSFHAFTDNIIEKPDFSLGYKGYRFFISSNRKIPFTSYNEINATIQYDTKLKSLLYGKMMLIETALKNIALMTIGRGFSIALRICRWLWSGHVSKNLHRTPDYVNKYFLNRKFFTGSF